MTDVSESRDNERKEYDTRLVCSYVNSENCHSVVMGNYSRGGIYFEAYHAFKPGALVQVYSRSGKYPELSDKKDFSGFKNVATTKVKWCREIEGRDFPVYAVGAEYCRSDQGQRG